MSSPRIEHFLAANEQTVSSFLSDQGLTSEKISYLLHMGAIYVNGLRLRADTKLQVGQVLRLHREPKLYTWDQAQPLSKRIVFADEELLVLDKPHGLPVHPTLDNFVDNAKFILERELSRPLYSTHRLDVPTAGLLIFAKTPKAQALINKAFARRRVEKIYHALTERPVPVGAHTLYLNPETHVPRESSLTKRDGWWECRLTVEACAPHALGYCNRIRLETGKTHQIRAQLASLNSPILGDVLYGSEKKYVHERLALECYSLSLTFRSRTLAIARPNSIAQTIPRGSSEFPS